MGNTDIPEFTRRKRSLELTETKRGIRYSKIPETIEDLADAQTIQNSELPETMQSEAFDIGKTDPTVKDRRHDVF